MKRRAFQQKDYLRENTEARKSRFEELQGGAVRQEGVVLMKQSGALSHLLLLPKENNEFTFTPIFKVVLDTHPSRVI